MVLHPQPVVEFRKEHVGSLVGEAVTEALQRRYEAVTHSLDGDIFLVLRERERAILKYNEALTVDPDEKNWFNTVYQTGDPRG